MTPGSALVVLYKKNLEDTEKRVLGAGGEIIKRPGFPGEGGRRFHFRGPAGNVLGV